LIDQSNFFYVLAISVLVWESRIQVQHGVISWRTRHKNNSVNGFVLHPRYFRYLALHCNEHFSAKNFHSGQVAMRFYMTLTNIFKEMGCNEGLYHCLRWWCGWMTGNSSWNEAWNKVLPLPYSPPVHKSLSHVLSNVLRKFTQVFTSWNSGTSV